MSNGSVTLALRKRPSKFFSRPDSAARVMRAAGWGACAREQQPAGSGQAGHRNSPLHAASLLARIMVFRCFFSTSRYSLRRAPSWPGVPDQSARCSAAASNSLRLGWPGALRWRRRLCRRRRSCAWKNPPSERGAVDGGSRRGLDCGAGRAQRRRPAAPPKAWRPRRSPAARRSPRALPTAAPGEGSKHRIGDETDALRDLFVAQREQGGFGEPQPVQFFAASGAGLDVDFRQPALVFGELLEIVIPANRMASNS